VCRYDRIDENGAVLPRRRSGIDEFLGEWGNKPHVRSGFAELLTIMALECHWDTLTAVVFRSSVLDKAGLFRADCGNAADRCWRWKAATVGDFVYVPEYLATWRTHSEQSTAKTLVDPNHTRLVCQLARETVDEIQFLIPDRWKSAPEWREKLLHHFWVEYLRGYGLDRATLRSRPGAFVKGALRALVREPGYLMRRLGNGLSWHDPLLENEVVRLRRLIEEWNVPWPPVPLDL